jgi:glycerol-3-phosphate dehydrogenase subunit C
MTVREGSLEAPTRHPIDWKSLEFYDEKSCFDEMERVFDICHGCRRCVSLCNSFPRLFDLIDEGPTGEMDGVPREKYWEVVDQCYLCDVCYMTKCPYVPPHPWNLDFPHLMLRAKAIQFKQGTPTKFRDTTLSNTAANGKLASIPIVVQTVNALAKNKTARALGEKILGVHKDAWLPEYASTPFEKSHAVSKALPVKDGAKTPGKVAIYSTCYVNWNEPGIGHDLIKVLEHNEIPYVVVEKQACCGMPKLELGDLESVETLAKQNLPVLAKLAREGYAIMTPIPSCTLMFKQEIPLMFPNDADAQAVKAAMFDPFEYFVNRNKDGLLKTDFKQGLGNVSYHIACHLRVQNVGQKTREMLEMVPDTAVNTVERCSGHAGTWGVKKEFHEIAMKIGRPVFRQMGEHPKANDGKGGEPDYVASDCQLAGHHIEQGMAGKADGKVEHPLSLLAKAYGY